MPRNPGIVQDLENSERDPYDPAKHHNDPHDQRESHDSATRLALAVATDDGDRIGHAMKLAGENLVKRLAAGWLLSNRVGVGGAIIVNRSRLCCAGSHLNWPSDRRRLDRRKQSTGIGTSDGWPKEALTIGVTQRSYRVIAGGFVCDHETIVPYLRRKLRARDASTQRTQREGPEPKLEPLPQSLPSE